MTDAKSQTFMAYVADLELAVQAYNDPLNPDEIIRLIKLTSEQQVVNARVTAYTDKMLQALVHLGREEEAIYSAQLRDDILGKRFDGLFAIWEVSESGRVTESKLMQAIDHIPRPVDQVYPLCKLALAVNKTNAPRADEIFAHARQIALSIKNTSKIDDETHVRSILAETLMETGRFGAVRQVAETFRMSVNTDIILRKIIRLLAHAGHFKRAYQLAEAITNTDQKADALSDIASALAKINDPRADETFNRARDLIDTIEYDRDRDSALSRFAEGLSQANRFDEARTVIDTIQDSEGYSKAYAFRALAKALSQTRRFDDVHKVVNAIHITRFGINVTDSFKAETLIQITTELVQAQHFSQARELVDSFQSATDQAKALIQLTTALYKVDDSRMNETLQHALAVADTIQAAESKADALSEIVSILVPIDIERAETTFQRACMVATTIQDRFSKKDYHKAVALRQLAVGLGKVQRFDEANEIATNIEHNSVRTDTLDKLATRIAEADTPRTNENFQQGHEVTIASQDQKAPSRLKTLIQSQRFDEAQEVINAIKKSHTQANAQYKLAVALAQSQRFDEARKQIDELDMTRKSVAYSKLAESLAEADDPRADEVFKLAREVALESWDIPAQSVELTELASALARVRRFDEALEVANLIQEGEFEKSFALSNVAKALAQADDSRADDTFDHAKANLDDARVGDTIKDDALNQIAIAVAQTKQLKRSVVVRGLCDIDAYVKFLADWQPILAEMYPDEPKLWQQVMLSALEIVCWVRTDYEPTRDIFRLVGEND